MPLIKCKEKDCPHDIIFSHRKSTVVIGAAGGNDDSRDADKQPGVEKTITRYLTLSCLLKHVHNYEITFKTK